MMKKGNREHERQGKTAKEKFVVPATAATIAGIGVAGYYSGIIPELLDMQLTLQPPTIDGAVEGMVAANETIREASPVIAASMVGLMASYAIRGRFSSKQRMLNKLSRTEYSGVDDVVSGPEKKSRISRVKRAIGGVAVVPAILIMATSGLEDEVSNGPNRPNETALSMLAPDDPEPLIILQGDNSPGSGKQSLMDASVVSEAKIQDLLEAADDEMFVAPFGRDFMNVNNKSAIQFSIPDAIFEQVSGAEIDQTCKAIPIITSDTLDVAIGETASINGVDAQVVKREPNIAQMNRNIAIVSDTDTKECLKDGTDQSYFGAVISHSSFDEVQELIDERNIDGVSVITQEQFFENNRNFWQANGTPIILILMGSVAVLGGIVVAKQRRGALQRNAREIGMLNAAGVSMKDIESIENRRSLRESLYATAIATPVGVGFAAAFNASVNGLGAAVDARAVTVAAALTATSSMVASRRSAKSFSKRLDIAQAVKG